MNSTQSSALESAVQKVLISNNLHATIASPPKGNIRYEAGSRSPETKLQTYPGIWDQ